MRTAAMLGVLLVAGVEFVALVLHQQRFVMATAGAVTALLQLGILRMLQTPGAAHLRDREAPDDAGDLLRHWLSSTESQIHWSESTRIDWDRHWRPILARRFEISTGHRRAENPAAFDATGRMLFGAELWQWVDPGNVARTGCDEPGPGRATLEELLRRLVQ